MLAPIVVPLPGCVSNRDALMAVASGPWEYSCLSGILVNMRPLITGVRSFIQIHIISNKGVVHSSRGNYTISQVSGIRSPSQSPL